MSCKATSRGRCRAPGYRRRALRRCRGTQAGEQGEKGSTKKARPLRAQCLRKPDVTLVRQVAFFQGVVESKLPNPHCRAMRGKIDSVEGRAIHAQRMGMIEPVFGHTQQRGLRRFTLRGKAKVDTQICRLDKAARARKAPHARLNRLVTSAAPRIG